MMCKHTSYLDVVTFKCFQPVTSDSCVGDNSYSYSCCVTVYPGVSCPQKFCTSQDG